MMSSAVTSCGASERDIRKRSGWPGWRMRDVAGGVEHALVGEDAARRREIFQRGAIDGAAGRAHAISRFPVRCFPARPSIAGEVAPS